jgi:beta-glucosidase
MAVPIINPFPEGFIWGTSTAAYQIETAFDHDWMGVKSRDGHVFHRTSDHELRRKEDAALIASLAPAYRMSLMWSRLQAAPFAPFNAEVVAEYRHFMEDLRAKGVRIMLVMHHFTHPLWFVKEGAWLNPRMVSAFVDHASQLIKYFGDLVSWWNTFNEPNVYVSNAYIMGEFPPFKKLSPNALGVIRAMAGAHERIYVLIKKAYPDSPVGISHNCVDFYGLNTIGKLAAGVADYWFNEYIPSLFNPLDFFGMSYYARMGFDPAPVTWIDTPEKMTRLGLPHDGMWEYSPEGLGKFIRRYWNQYRLPVIITESGICTDRDEERISAIRDYLFQLGQCLKEGVPLNGYFFWSSFDNFEWNLGPTYRFGLYACDLLTKDRHPRPSAEFYRSVVRSNGMAIY